MTSNRFPAALALLAVTGVSSVAFAHPGHVSGLAHPLTGLDHLLAALCVGIIAMQRRDAWRLPVTFTLSMLAGMVLASLLPALPGVELGVAGSVLVLGLLAATAAKLPQAAVAATVGGFALLHGHAHGTEGAGLTYVAGIAFTTLALHFTGVGLALAARRLPGALDRAAGAAIAATGAALLIAL